MAAQWQFQCCLLVLDTLPAAYTFQVGTIVYSAAVQNLISAYQIGNPGYQPFTATTVSGGRTLLKWDFTPLIFPGNGAQFYIQYKIKVKTGTAPTNISNCFSVEGYSVVGQGNNVRIDPVTDCDNVPIQPVGPVQTAKVISVTDGTVQPTEEFYYTLQFRNSGPFAVNNLRIADVLPQYLELIQSEAIVYTNLPNPTTYSYNPTTRTLYWEWSTLAGADMGNALSDLKEIRYKVRVKAGVLANVTFNNCFRIDGQGPNIDVRRTTSSNGSAENENLTPYIAQTCSNNLSVLTLATVRSRKGVKGDCDNDFVYFDPNGALPPDLNNLNGIGRTFAGGEATYRLQIFNPGNIVVKNVVLVDILPFIGDKGVLRIDEARLTEWRPTLAAPITAPAGVTVYYSYEQNPCRPEFNPGINPSGCTGPNWTATPPSDLSLVQSIKLDFSGLEIGPADTFSIDWRMFAPYQAPNNKIAWNSFAFQGRRKDNNNLFLTAEPNKVGIAVKSDPRSEIGNYVWVDRNMNGLQDEPSTEGVNNIKVNLIRSTDLIKGNIDDVLIDFTVTGFDINGNAGYYLFPNLPAGNYYVVFDLATLPPTTAVTTQNANNNNSDALDSDADPVMGMTQMVTLGVPESNITLDMGITPPDCFLSGTSIVPSCDNNGTPNNLNDDKITLQSITAFRTGTTGGSKYTLIIEYCRPNLPTVQLLVQSGLNYGQVYGPFGPYNVAF
ncbi:MAG: MSCRAMM family adhesin SdrC, partial [Bacteroidetes bacterium]|nr:MSCRAMM family adhesin SdrC [Bacteroidota bacterium]